MKYLKILMNAYIYIIPMLPMITTGLGYGYSQSVIR